MQELSTRQGQSIILNDNIRITVVGVKGNRVQLRVKAPDDVTVSPEDVYFAEIKSRVDREVAERERLASGCNKKPSKLSLILQALRTPIARVFSTSH